LRDFDPTTDIVLDSSGLQDWSATARAQKPHLIADVEEYFATREEDEYFVAP
jgi:hypothetical protein